MLKTRPLIIAAVAAATVSATALSNQAYANDDALLGAVVGAGIGAAIGHGIQGRDGAVVGGAIGAIAGASIAANSPHYYDSRYYEAPATGYAPATVYYGAAPAYYPTIPVYYPRPRVYDAPRVEYVPYHGAHYADRGRPYDHGYANWRNNEGHREH